MNFDEQLIGIQVENVNLTFDIGNRSESDRDLYESRLSACRTAQPHMDGLRLSIDSRVSESCTPTVDLPITGQITVSFLHFLVHEI